MWYFLLGFVPFVNILRAYPSPSFWQEILVFLVFGAWIVRVSFCKSQPQSIRLTWFTLAFVILMILVMAQPIMGHELQPNTRIQVLVVLLGGLLVHQTSLSVAAARRGNLSQVLVPFAWGLMLALFLNVASAILSAQGLELMLYRLVQSNPAVRAGGMFGQPNEFGVFCVLAMLGWRYLFRQAKAPPVIYHVVCTIAFLGVAASGSRAALVVWVGISVLEYLCIPADAGKRRDFWLTQALFIGAQILWLVALRWGKGETVPAAGVLRGDYGARYEQYRDAFLLASENPWFGIGWGKVAEARFFDLSHSLMEPNAAHLHNFITNLYVELGLGGGVVGALLIYGVWHVCLKSKATSNEKGEHVFMASFLLGVLIYSLFEYPLWYVYFLYVFAFVAGLIIDPLGGRWARLKGGASLSRVGGLLILVCGLAAAWDYSRVQFGLMRLMDDLNGVSGTAISEVDVLRLRQSTMFVDQVDNIWLDISDYRDGAAEIKFPVADRLFRHTPSIGGAIHLITYALAADKPDQAEWVLGRFKQGNPKMYTAIVQYLAGMASSDARIERFLLEHGVTFRDES